MRRWRMDLAEARLAMLGVWLRRPGLLSRQAEKLRRRMTAVQGLLVALRRRRMG